MYGLAWNRNCQFWRQLKIIIFKHLYWWLYFHHFLLSCWCYWEHYCRLVQKKKIFFQFLLNFRSKFRKNEECMLEYKPYFTIWFLLCCIMVPLEMFCRVIGQNEMLHPNVPRRVTRCLTAWHIPLSIVEQ